MGFDELVHGGWLTGAWYDSWWMGAWRLMHECGEWGLFHGCMGSISWVHGVYFMGAYGRVLMSHSRTLGCMPCTRQYRLVYTPCTTLYRLVCMPCTTLYRLVCMPCTTLYRLVWDVQTGQGEGQWRKVWLHLIKQRQWRLVFVSIYNITNKKIQNIGPEIFIT